jgi:hypothetical protein
MISRNRSALTPAAMLIECATSANKTVTCLYSGGQAGDRGLGFVHVTVRPAIWQCLHQDTDRGNAPRQQLSLAEEMVGGGPHER